MQDTHQSGTVREKPAVHTVNISIAKKSGKEGQEVKLASKQKKAALRSDSKKSEGKTVSKSKRSQTPTEIVIRDEQQLKKGRSPPNEDLKRILHQVNANNRKFD